MRVFISYARKDASQEALSLAGALRHRGFETWLDVENGVPVGAPFDVRIEEGIAASEVMVALLSPGSLRDDSFCRKELLYAQAQHVPVIPVRLADVPLPVQIVSLNYLDAVSDCAAAFAQLPAIIEQVAVSRQMPPRSWGLPGQGTPWWTRLPQLSFAEELARYGGSFIGREWLFAEMGEWVRQADSRLYLLTGDAGVGKSAIAAQLSARLPVQSLHFCTRSSIESCRPSAWLAVLVYQLAARFDPYRTAIEARGRPDWQESPLSLFRGLVSDPLRECREQLGIAEPWVLVVDGLDEAVAETGLALPDLLAESVARLPDWLRLVVTGRPDQGVVARFRLEGVRHRHLSNDEPENLKDVQAFVHRALEATGAADAGADVASRQLTELAEGNFLVAQMALAARRGASPGSPREAGSPATVPRDLGGVFHEMFRTRFGDAAGYEQDILPLLECLVAARGSLPEELLVVASGLEHQAAHRSLRALSQFLHRGPSGLSLFHRALGDWLGTREASAEYAVRPEVGHARLATACSEALDVRGPASAYAVAHLAAHLSLAGEQCPLMHLLADLAFVERKCLSGMVSGLLEDYQRVGAGPFRPAPPVRTAWHGGGRHAVSCPFCLACSEVGSRRLGTVLPCPACGTELRLNTFSLDRTWIASPARREAQSPASANPGPLPDSVSEFADFVHSEARVLQFYPELCVHTARNWPEGTAPRTAATLLMSEREKGGPWLRLVHGSVGDHAGTKTLIGHRDAVTACAYSPDGGRLVTASTDGTLRLWNAQSGATVALLVGHGDWVWDCEYSPDGELIGSASWDGTIRVWEAHTGGLLRTIEAYTEPAHCCTFSPDGAKIASGSSEGVVRLWDAREGGELTGVRGHEGAVEQAAFSPDGRLLATASQDRTVRVWEAETGADLAVLRGHTGGVCACAFSPDGRRLTSLSWKDGLRVWDTRDWRQVAASGPSCHEQQACAYSPDGARLLTVGGSSGQPSLQVWDAGGGAPTLVAEEGFSRGLTACAWSPDGHRAAVASRDHTVTMLEGDRLTHATRRSGHSAAVLACAYSPCGGELVTASQDHTLIVWASDSGLPTSALVGHEGAVTDCAFSPEGTRLVSASRDGSLRIWDVEAGGQVGLLRGHHDGVTACAWSPLGRHVISGSLDGALLIWESESGKQVGSLTGHACGVQACQYSPDGVRLASGAGALGRGELKVWDASDGREVWGRPAHSKAVTAVAYSREGDRLYSASEDASLKCWEGESGG